MRISNGCRYKGWLCVKRTDGTWQAYHQTKGIVFAHVANPAPSGYASLKAKIDERG